MEHQINSRVKLTLAPSGHLHVEAHKGDGNGYSEIHHQPVIQAFMASQEQGLLHLLTTKIDNTWSDLALICRRPS